MLRGNVYATLQSNLGDSVQYSTVSFDTMEVSAEEYALSGSKWRNAISNAHASLPNTICSIVHKAVPSKPLFLCLGHLPQMLKVTKLRCTRQVCRRYANLIPPLTPIARHVFLAFLEQAQNWEQIRTWVQEYYLVCQQLWQAILGRNFILILTHSNWGINVA